MKDELLWGATIDDRSLSLAETIADAIGGALEDAYPLEPGKGPIKVYVTRALRAKPSRFVNAKAFLDEIRHNLESTYADVDLPSLWPAVKNVPDMARASLEVELGSVINAWVEKYGLKIDFWHENEPVETVEVIATVDEYGNVDCWEFDANSLEMTDFTEEDLYGAQIQEG